MIEIIYKKESYFLTGLFFKVHDKLGRFAKEKQYCNELEKVFIENNVDYKREYTFSKDCDEMQKGDRVDFMVYCKIIIEVKAKPLITKDDYAQTQRYLKAANCKLGLIVNFRNNYVKPKRALNKYCTNYI
jgi:GxxExxY protein